MHRWSPVIFVQETTAAMLLVHTVAIVLYLCVGLILLKALVRLRHAGEPLAGLFTIVILTLLTSVARLVWIGMIWLDFAPPPWLDLSILALVYTGMMATPIVLSAFYLPFERKRGLNLPVLLHWGMIANALLGVVVLLSAFAHGNSFLLFLATPLIYTSAAILLCARIASVTSLQARRRSLFLFASFTSAGLLMVVAVLVYGGINHVQVRRTSGPATLLEFSSLLILIGMLFVFANLRLADIIVKRVLRLALWMCTALFVWIAMTLLVNSMAYRTGMRPEAVRDLLSVMLIAAFGAATPPGFRLLDLWIDRWIFQQPDFDAAIKMLWERLVLDETETEVFDEAAKLIGETLGLSAVRVESASPLVEPVKGPGAYIHQPTTALQSPGTGEISVPLFVEGCVARWFILTRGIMRAPLTAMEIAFVERAAAQVQVRLETMLAEERRIEDVRRQAAFREELSDAELRALRAQINPHFLFNSLNTIADLTVTAPERAEQMTLRLSAVFRYVLVNTEKQFASLQEEVDFAKSYLAIEEFRFGARLKTCIDIEPSVLRERVPTLLLQPLIENALKHGLAPRRNGGTISISARSTNAEVMLVVADDGMGLHASRSAVTGGTHVGLANVRKRLATAYQGSASFDLRPREGGGTEAIVIIKKGWQTHENLDRRR